MTVSAPPERKKRIVNLDRLMAMIEPCGGKLADVKAMAYARWLHAVEISIARRRLGEIRIKPHPLVPASAVSRDHRRHFWWDCGREFGELLRSPTWPLTRVFKTEKITRWLAQFLGTPDVKVSRLGYVMTGFYYDDGRHGHRQLDPEKIDAFIAWLLDGGFSESDKKKYLQWFDDHPDCRYQEKPEYKGE